MTRSRGPRDVAILQQRDHIVGHGTAHGILKIQNAGIVLLGHQQIARVIVAMHEHLQAASSALLASVSNSRSSMARSPAVNVQTEMAAEEPFRQELHLAHEHRAVVRWQSARGVAPRGLHAAQALRAHRRRDARRRARRAARSSIAAFPNPTAAETRAPRSRARITGTFKPMPSSDCATSTNGASGFLLGRRIHHDVGIRAADHAKIAAKARIRRRGLDRAAGETQILRHPSRNSARRESLASDTSMLDHSATANAAVPSIPTKAMHFAQGFSVRAALAAVFCLLAAAAVRADDICPAPPKHKPDRRRDHPERRSPHPHRQRRCHRSTRDGNRRAHRPRAACVRTNAASRPTRSPTMRRPARSRSRARWISRIRGSGAQRRRQLRSPRRRDFNQANFQLLDRNGRGFAKDMSVHPGRQRALDTVRYTSCPVGNEDWMLQAITRSISTPKPQEGIAHDVVMRFKDVPIFYTPYISLSRGRRTQERRAVPELRPFRQQRLSSWKCPTTSTWRPTTI